MMGKNGRSENEALMKDALKEPSWSFRQIVILVSLCVACMFEYATVSLPNPFLPTEAQKRGVPISLVGVIFACSPLTVCLFATVWAQLIPRYGASRILVFGLVLCSACLFLFALCKLLHTAASFASVALVLRSLSAIGAAASETSSTAIALGEFPQNVGLVTGVMATFELSHSQGLLGTFSGVGFGIGPALGGFLYTAGGFQLPFIVFGSVIAAFVPIFLALYKKRESESDEKQQQKEKEKKSSMLEALQIPGVIVIALCLVTSGSSYTITGPILSSHLKPLGLNAFHIGLIFVCESLSYGCFTPVMGWIGDQTQCYRLMIVVGCFGDGISFLLLGPAPFLSSILPTRKVWLVCVAMALMGFQCAVFSAVLMPALKEIARNYGMADNASTNGILSGIYSSMLNLGATIGPLLGGILYQHIGFQWTTTIEGFILFCQGLIVVAFVTIEKLVKRRKSTEDIQEEIKLIR